MKGIEEDFQSRRFNDGFKEDTESAVENCS
jgi:hypothetical protein